MLVSVICPVYNEEKYISQLIDSVLAQETSGVEYELLLVDGMSTDRTREIIGTYLKRYTFMRLIDNPHRTAPYAMNIGIEAARGEVIVRIDAHASFPPDYLSVLLTGLEMYKTDVVGVACRTEVMHITDKSLAIKAVLSSRFGVGNSAFRLGVNKAMETDTVPFGCWRRQTFDKYGMFDTRLTRNQDIELSKRIIRGGGHIWILPDTECIYYARETFRELMENNYSNGMWNILTVYYTREFSSLSVRHFVPMAFVLSLTLPLLLMFVSPLFGIIPALVAVLYLVTICSVSASLCRLRKLKFGYVAAAFVLLHLSYGAGSIAALFRLPFLNRNANR